MDQHATEPAHLIDKILDCAMLDIRMFDQIQRATAPPRPRHRLWRFKSPKPRQFDNLSVEQTPTWYIADLLHNSVGYLTLGRPYPLSMHKWTPGEEALWQFAERVDFTADPATDLHQAWVQRALARGGWTLTDLETWYRSNL